MMNDSQLVALIRALADNSHSRRVLARGLIGMAVAIGLVKIDSDETRARKGKKRKNRARNHNRRGNAPQRARPPLVFNRFGCVDIGQPCRGDSANCCSGICQGAAPAAGKPDTSRCVAHNAGTCSAQTDSCTAGGVVVCNSTIPGRECFCLRTTGQAGFCAEFVEDDDVCRVCARDKDCEPEFGPGAACIVLEGACTTSCPATGGTACVRACP